MTLIPHFFRGRPSFIIWGIASLTLVVWAAFAFGAYHNADNLERQEIEQLSRGMRTVCVGRFLIDLPAEAQIELGKTRIHGFDIAVFDETRSDFQQRLADRKAQLQATVDWLGGTQNLESERPIRSDSGATGTIFVHGRKVTEGSRARGLELERYRNEGIATEALVHSDDISIDMAADYYDPDQLENLPRLVSRLVPNPKNKVPVEPGFCIERAYFRDPLTAEQGEQIMMSVHLPRHPDIEFLLILAAGQKPDVETLLVRAAAAEARLPLLGRLRLSTIRAAPRVIGGLAGEELIQFYVEANDKHVYPYWWEVNGKEDDVLVPHVVFHMTTGQGQNGPAPASMSGKAARALWETVSSSIRLRPASNVRAIDLRKQTGPTVRMPASMPKSTGVYREAA